MKKYFIGGISIIAAIITIVVGTISIMQFINIKSIFSNPEREIEILLDKTLSQYHFCLTGTLDKEETDHPIFNGYDDSTMSRIGIENIWNTKNFLIEMTDRYKDLSFKEKPDGTFVQFQLNKNWKKYFRKRKASKYSTREYYYGICAGSYKLTKIVKIIHGSGSKMNQAIVKFSFKPFLYKEFLKSDGTPFDSFKNKLKIQKRVCVAYKEFDVWEFKYHLFDSRCDN